MTLDDYEADFLRRVRERRQMQQREVKDVAAKPVLREKQVMILDVEDVEVRPATRKSCTYCGAETPAVAMYRRTKHQLCFSCKTRLVTVP